MTDSMKFGPEWLRNLSAESLSNSGLGATHTQPSNNNGIGLQNPSCSAPTRNMFPEFRYGREEMLSLFDKNCNIPEILPRYKSLFVEKVQYPLAMTPCTEDEVPIPTPAPNTGRPAWIQRSPVGFNTSMRGISRGGSVDRGRLRGKLVYHSGFQRTTPTFEDDSRPIPVKADRNWADRNGEHLPNPVVGMEWNGAVIASPRREFPSHSRNLENWRRSRTDDVSNELPSSGIGTSSNEGWRTSSFGSSNRWGRSTSWREEDTNNDVGNQSGGFVTIQRSFSTLGSVSDRNCVGGNSNISTTKSQVPTKFESHSTTNNVPAVSGSMNTAQNMNSKHAPEWSGAQGGNSSSTDFDDNLPEWATESASDIGGTFDATGAFHGTTQTEETTKADTQIKDISDNLPSDKSETVMKTLENMNDLCNINQIDSKNSLHDAFKKDITDPASQVKANSKIMSKSKATEEFLQNNICAQSNISGSSKNKTKKEEPLSTISDTTCLKDDTLPAKSDVLSDFKYDISQKPLNADISDQMKEVTNNMIEKLIMDDDCGINNNIVNSSRTPKSFVSTAVGASIFKQPGAQQITSEADVLPQPIPTTSNMGQKSNTLYCGDVGNHSEINQHELQNQKSDIGTPKVVGITQPQIMGAVHGATDLWYYRDPQSKVQGPFTAIEMTEWYRAGYFNENLFVRRICDTRFRALGELITICNGNVPFTHNHMLPLDLDSVPINNPIIFNDYVLNSHQNEHCEELKGNVTAAADSLSHAVKSVISSVDMSQMLNMHFQMLQDQYIRHQEMAIVTELSKNECFQRLSAHDKEAVVRQKVQMLILPDYLSSLAGLRNSLAVLNPTAGNQLYDAIAECSRKDHAFSSACQSPHLQQINTSSPIMPGDDLGRNTAIQNQNQVKYSTLQYSPVLPAANECEINVNKVTSDSETLSGNNLLSEFNLRMMLTGGHINTLAAPQNKMSEFINANDAANRVDFKVDQQMPSTTGQSPLIHMWMPTTNNNNSMQHQMVTPQPNNQWPDRLLVNISNTQVEPVLEPTNLRQSIWNTANAENAGNHLDHSQNPSNANDKGPSLEEKKNFQIKRQHTSDISFKETYVSTQKPQSSGSEDLTKVSSLSSSASNKQEKISTNTQNTNKKNKTTSVSATSTKIKEESLFIKRNEEERRRETLEDKRRQKEERKRLQVEEEKRRLQIVEDEKKRQLQEEKERQLLIQSQRRKALLGNNSSTSVGGNVLNSKNTKESQVQTKIQTSIAPWSLQSAGGSGDSGPGLAEIQKAERRERRADQQRQSEMSIKANASVVAESNEAILKWNASPLPVKSFAEIQAEEAKRLAAENIELQRRKEQEQLAIITTATNLNNVNSSNHMSNIWVGNKVWSSPNTSSFWEDNTKYGTSTASIIGLSASAVATASLSSGTTPQSSSTTLNTNPQQANMASNRNLRKSQTVSVMQNSISKNTVPQTDKNINNVKKIQTKTDSPDNKKSTGKKQIPIENIPTNNNQNEFEKEFTSWCTKYLNNMNTIVDVPTFVTFLQDLESPYEVKDYIRMYLGESKESTDFAKQFLERRNRYKNLQRAQNAHNDDMCKPAPALTPSGNDHNDNKGKQKKVKKSKMTKLDARILGFSVTAAEGRINVGDRDYVDAP